MSIDQEVLAGYARYEDETGGIAEEFVRPALGGVRAIAVHSRPLGRTEPLAFVICHSFGIEQIHLGRHEVTVARALSAAGFPVLRYHGAGYGDSGGDMRKVGLATHLADARDAIAFLASQDGVAEVAVYGARFGASVAGLAAEREGLGKMALWDPVVRGAGYMRELLRSHVFFEMSESKGEGEVGGVGRLLQDLESQGWADVKGFPLSREAHDAIAAMDLTKDIVAFRGSALVGSLSKQGHPTPGAKDLAAHLCEIGADCTQESVADPAAAEFGAYHYHTVNREDGTLTKADTQVQLTLEIGRRTVAWASGHRAEPEGR